MSPARILVVEDEVVVARDVRARLSGLGYEVTGWARTGEEAVRLAASTRPDLVLMDIRLTGAIDGIEAAGKIRSELGLPVVYLTAYADDDTLARAKPTEPFGYLLKPFDERDLRAVVEMAVYKHQAETKLRDSERRYAVTLASIGDAVIATDGTSRVTFINPTAEALTGWPASEAEGRVLSEVFRIVNEHTREPVEDPAANVLRLGTVVGLANHTILLARDGGERPIDDSGAPIRDDTGAISGVVVVFHDVTEQRRAENALRESEERFRSMFESAPIGMALTDVRGQYLQTNTSYERMVGYLGPELRAMSLIELVHPDDREAARRGLDALAAGRLDVSRREHRYVRKDGTSIWIDGTDSVVRGADGGARFFVKMAVDITEQNRAEAEREELHRQVLTSREQLQVLSRRLIESQEDERRRLAGELHDEIGQILTAVSLNLEAARQTAGEAAQPRLEDSMRAVDRAIEQVRTLALNLRPTMLDVMGLESAIRWYVDRRVGPGGSSVEFVSTLVGARVARELETACFRVVQEALTNAVRHARAARVRIELSRSDEALHLTVSDDGAGFDVAAAVRRALQGETFGLIGMQERVQLLGGDIQIRSTPGAGCEVRVRLPLR